MADARKPHDFPFIVRQAGLTYGDELGAILGFDDKAKAEENAADRNGRAKVMGLKATYEAFTTGKPIPAA